MKKSDKMEIANMVYNLLKDHAKKAKKYLVGKSFIYRKKEGTGRTHYVMLNNYSFSKSIKNDSVRVLIAPDKMGVIHAGVTFPQPFSWNLKDLRAITKVFVDALSYMEDAEKNTELKDILDP